jgi:pilus assembly protein CpaF
MFTIIISEKWGAERRESFDKNEINVGRVQGNDLMLPKGNVSKHHARLLYRDGRFIVTDLKSTNGTYVNGRKIAQATIVREGDKIYIGDFVLKLDTGAASQNPPEPSAYPHDQRATGNVQPAPLQPIQPVPVQMAAQMAGGMQPTAQMPQMPPVAPPHLPPQMPPLPQPIGQPNAAPSSPQYALDRDPDESQNNQAQGQVPKMPPAPRVPNVPANARVGNSTAVLPQGRAGTQQQQQVQPPPIAAPPAAAQASRVPASPSVPPRQLPRETPAQAGRRLALITLVDRVADVIDLAPLKKSATVDEALTQQIDRNVREQAKAMRDEGEAPEGIDLELLVRDALREFVGLGPVGPLLEDDEVSEIHATRHDYVLAVRGGVPVLADASFTSEEALHRAVTRLANQAGEPWQPGEVVLERRLARGATMVAILPPAAAGCVLVIRKRRKVESSLEDFVRSGAISRPMASFLEHCLAARANILVTGTGGIVVASTLSALASAGPAGDRIAVLQDTEDLGVAQAHAVALALPDHRARGEEAVRAAAALRGDRLVIGTLAGNVVAATLDAIAEGAEGVIAGAYAPSLRHALSRLVAQLSLVRPGIGVEAAREALGESFDVAVEVAKLPDGRLRVTRIAELAGSDGKGVAVRDLFTLSADGPTGEGAFVASGVVPRLVGDFASRGVRIDANLFKRTVGRN